MQAKSETFRDIQNDEDLLGEEIQKSDEEGGLLASPIQKEKILICQDCSKILVSGLVLHGDSQEENK